MVDPRYAEDGLAIDWEYLLQNLEPNIDFCEQSSADGFSNSSFCMSIDDIENYLLNDEPDFRKEDDCSRIGVEDAFFSDVVLNSAPESESDRCKDSSSSGSPESAAAVAPEVDEGKDKDESSAEVERTKERNDVVGEDTDPAAKKRKRQIRNRDAAVRSRERKKMYVTDLEMKSKFFEAECRRLGSLLQCCIAENQALRFYLHNTKASDASMAKQESAVLLLESLLLGSLLGFLGIIICLLILPSRCRQHQLVSLLKSGDSAERGKRAPTRAASKVFNFPTHPFYMGRKCKASRSRMKKMMFHAQIIF